MHFQHCNLHIIPNIRRLGQEDSMAKILWSKNNCKNSREIKMTMECLCLFLWKNWDDKTGKRSSVQLPCLHRKESNKDEEAWSLLRPLSIFIVFIEQKSSSLICYCLFILFTQLPNTISLLISECANRLFHRPLNNRNSSCVNVTIGIWAQRRLR